MAGVVYELTRGNQRGLYAAAACIYAERYPDRYHPPPRSFLRSHTNALAYGNFNPPRPANYEVQENIHTGEILAAFEENPHTSSRAVAQTVGVSQYTVVNVLQKNLIMPSFTQSSSIKR